MTIRQILDRLDNFTDAERERYLRPLTKMLCVVSKQTLLNYQNAHLPKTRNFAEFMPGFAAQIRQCVALEVSEIIGKPVRASLGLPPITLDTEVPETS